MLTAGRLDAAVDVVQPREVVEVAAFAGEHEPGGHRGRPVVAVAAAAVDVADPLGTPGVGQQVEQPALDWGEPVAPGIGAAQPAREQPDRHPDPGPVPERVGAFGLIRRRPQRLHLRPELRLHRGQETPFRHDKRVGQLPVVQPGYHHREVGQVGYRAHPVGMQQLIRPQFAHPQHLVSHGRHPHLATGPRWLES